MPWMHPDSEIIDAMGGSGEVARLCLISSQAVSQWRRAGIPGARRQYLQLVRPGAFSQRKEPMAAEDMRDGSDAVRAAV